ncbi:MAG TPA: alpha-amylase family glycosyl hydrolase [Candidatus Woesebacteria bacterium]|nr:alpha-amylase family glycosyl hydrolase [Candidatus Woesebacteria bacterium]
MNLESLSRPEALIKEHPCLYLINTRLWLNQLTKKYDSSLTIDKIPEKEWQTLFDKYDYFWFMGIYKESDASRQHAQKWAFQSRYALPDLDPDKDVTASPFAIPEYCPNPLIAKNWESWDKMVDFLHQNNKKVIIDFVPNHLALDCELAKNHPEFFIQGSRLQFESNPDFYHQMVASDGKTYYLAHGKDPNFPPWADTLQLNYGEPGLNLEMASTLQELTSHSDGLRCDMAMLLDPPTFLRTWGWTLSETQKKYLNEHSFWAENIPFIKNNIKKDFKFIGEVYWDQDYLSQYFDYLYDDRFYKDITRSPLDLKNHLGELLTSRSNKNPCRQALYIENHDEDRSVKSLGEKRSRAAAFLAAIIPDTMFIVNQGQENGWKIRPPMQINRFPAEVDNPQIQKFYQKLFNIINSPIYKSGTVQNCQVNQISGDTIALRLLSADEKSTAIFCLNISDSYSKCTIPEINKNTEIEIESLTEDKEIVPDSNRQNGIYIGLEPGEVQVIYYPNFTRIFDKI